MPALQVTIDEADGLIDLSRRITVRNAVPGETVEISTETSRSGVPWRASAVFQADAEGQVDLTRDAPQSGSYAGVDGMGLIWSQSPVGSSSRELFNQPVAEPLVTQIIVRIAGGQAQATLTQQLAGPGVTRREVREDGLVGTLYLPAGSGPHPAVLILNGSGGGINEPRAALYASHGYAAFALAYFKAPGLSDYISNTPLEYFQRGLQWLRRTVRPAHDFVALSGQSRGGQRINRPTRRRRFATAVPHRRAASADRSRPKSAPRLTVPVPAGCLCR